MPRISPSWLLCLVLAVPATARAHPRTQARIETKVARMTAALELEPGQADAIRDRLQATQAETRKLRHDPSLDRAGRRRAIRELRIATRSGVVSELTPAQRDRRNARIRARLERAADSKLRSLRILLELRDDQLEAVRTILLAAAQGRRAIREGNDPAEDPRMELRRLRRDTEARIRASLDPGQAEKFAELSRLRRPARARHHRGPR